jgi:hypothetical protein
MVKQGQFILMDHYFVMPHMQMIQTIQEKSIMWNMWKMNWLMTIYWTVHGWKLHK